MKKKYLSILLITVLILSFVGVGYEPAMTKDKLIEKADAASASAASYKVDVNLDMQGTMSSTEDNAIDNHLADDGLTEDGLTEDGLTEDGLSEDGLAEDDLTEDSLPSSYSFDLNYNMNISTVVKSGITKTEGIFNLNLSGSEISQPILSYSKTGKKYITTYTYDNTTKTWSKEKSEVNSESTGYFDDFNDDTMNDFTLADSLVSCNNKDCYQLTGVIDSASVSDTPATSELDLLGEDSLKINATIYIDSATFYPIKYVLDMSDNDFSKLDDTSDSNMSVSKCIITMDYQFNTVKSIKIPKKALKAKTIQSED